MRVTASLKTSSQFSFISLLWWLEVFISGRFISVKCFSSVVLSIYKTISKAKKQKQLSVMHRIFLQISGSGLSAATKCGQINAVWLKVALRKKNSFVSFLCIFSSYKSQLKFWCQEEDVKILPKIIDIDTFWEIRTWSTKHRQRLPRKLLDVSWSWTQRSISSIMIGDLTCLMVLEIR